METKWGFMQGWVVYIEPVYSLRSRMVLKPFYAFLTGLNFVVCVDESALPHPKMLIGG